MAYISFTHIVDNVWFYFSLNYLLLGKNQLGYAFSTLPIVFIYSNRFAIINLYVCYTMYIYIEYN